MFSIEAFDPEREAKTLTHSANVFHEALADGGDYYHVSNPKGDYDISYKSNIDWYAGIVPPYVGNILPDFRTYDEYDTEGLDLVTFASYEQLFCVKLTEYSIAIARIALLRTDLQVYFADPRILWFIEPNERLHIGKPTEPKHTLMTVGPLGKAFVRGTNIADSSLPMSDIFMFLSLFWLKPILNGRKLSDIKYLEFPYARIPSGIGGLLLKAEEAAILASQFGWQLSYDGDTMGKFRVADLARFYKLDYYRPDSTPANTLSVNNAMLFSMIRRTFDITAALSDDILQDKFREDLAEYEEAVLGGHRTLGLLMRGTDYITSGLATTSTRHQATADEMLPVIREWMETGNYDRVFLATEDKDILNRMRAELGSKLIAVSQERHSVSEFEKGQVINDLEKQLYTDDEYNERVIDTTVNYFYALHILSKCQAFLCSGQNNGWDTVRSMNGGKFERAMRMFDPAAGK